MRLLKQEDIGMTQKVIIKSNKYGINLILDSEIPFAELLNAKLTQLGKNTSVYHRDYQRK